MQEINVTSQEFSQNVSENIEEESTIGELIVFPGPSYQDDSENMYKSSQSLNPQGSTDRPPSSPSSKTPKKRKQDDPASKAVSHLESIVRHGSTVKEKSSNQKFCIYVAAQLDELPRGKKRIARNRIQTILSEFDEDESDHE